jgi:hypothetical protein
MGRRTLAGRRILLNTDCGLVTHDIARAAPSAHHGAMNLKRAFVLGCALLFTAPLAADELTERDLKAFTAMIDAAIARRDAETIVKHIAEHAVISATVNVQGRTQTLRMNKTQYRQLLAATWSAVSNYEYRRSNEKITIERDQATITADISESMVVQGQPVETKVRERATVENYDGTLMLTQLVANQVL